MTLLARNSDIASVGSETLLARNSDITNSDINAHWQGILSELMTPLARNSDLANETSLARNSDITNDITGKEF